MNTIYLRKLAAASHIVLAKGSGNLPGVTVWTGKTVWFSSRPVQNTDLQFLGGVVTWTGHKPAVFLPGLSYSRASFLKTQNLGNN
jgi:hypothetical protein